MEINAPTKTFQKSVKSKKYTVKFNGDNNFNKVNRNSKL